MAATTISLYIRGAGLLVVLGFYWRLRRQMRASGMLDPEFRRAMKLQKTDPTQSDRILSEFFEKRQAQEAKEREELRLLAPTDLKAAKELRKRLAREIELLGKAREKMTPEMAATPEAMEGLDTRKQAEEVARLDQTIQRLKGR